MQKKTYITPETTLFDIEPICADTMVVSILGSTDDTEDIGAKQFDDSFDSWAEYTAWADINSEYME